MVETMKQMGLFGTTIPEQYGGLGLDLTTYALIVKELSRGWISLSGVLNTHFIASFMINTSGPTSSGRTCFRRWHAVTFAAPSR
jgi:alkylation response protein AidB-like acyl-CoA dehydrogenase